MSGIAAVTAALAMLCAVGGITGHLERERLRTRRRRRGPGTPARASRRVRERRETEVAELAEALAAELAAGAVWAVAVRRAARSVPGRLGAEAAAAPDSATALARLAELDGAEGLRALVAVGATSERTGAPAAALVDQVCDALAARRQTRRVVAVELAPALATTRLLAALPLVGLLLGSALGSDPLRVLLLTTPGRSCLVAACALELGGLAWCRAIRRAASGG